MKEKQFFNLFFILTKRDVYMKNVYLSLISQKIRKIKIERSGF